jgi:hypothetical protein
VGFCYVGVVAVVAMRHCFGLLGNCVATVLRIKKTIAL